MDTREMARENRIWQWEEIMREREESGESIKAYCKSLGIHENGIAFKQALRSHMAQIQDPILGRYRGTIPAFHYYNSQNHRDVIIDLDGNYIASWILGEKQIEYLFRNGNVQ